MNTTVSVPNGIQSELMPPVYMDYNATTPLAPEVIAAITESLTVAWGNPSSCYEEGLLAKSLIERARLNVAQMIGANQSDIIFMSGGTEANNSVINSVIENYSSNARALSNADVGPMGEQSPGKPHVITSNQEHPAIIKVLEHLKKSNRIDVTYVKSRPNSGRVDVDDVICAITPFTCLITLMLANNETGIIQPVAEVGQRIAEINKSRRTVSLPTILYHTDAAQAIGKIPIDVTQLGVNFLPIVGHKFYGPRIGALYIRRPNIETPFLSLLKGGGQEGNLRSGTENTPMIVGLGKACELVTINIQMYESHMRSVRDYLEQRLLTTFGENRVHFNGKYSGIPRLPNTCNVSILGFTGSQILSEAKMVHASVGAACHTNSGPSSVLLSIGIEESVARCAIRLSVGRDTSPHDIDRVVLDLNAALQRLQAS